MRQRISEKNVFPIFDLEIEYDKLHHLFFRNCVFGHEYNEFQKTRACLNYNDCLQELFLDWKLRGTFISLEEMLISLEIGEDYFYEDVSEERLLDYIQFIINAVYFVNKCSESQEYTLYMNSDSVGNAIMDNSKNILNQLNAEFIESNGELIVVYKNEIAKVVAKKDDKLSDSINEYLRIDNRGDIKRKGEILCTLSKYLEPLEKNLNKTEFGKLCSDTTFLLNNIGIRHPLNYKNKFIDIDIEEIEKWYDITFDMLVSCMSVVPYIEIKEKILEIKNKIK